MSRLCSQSLSLRDQYQKTRESASQRFYDSHLSTAPGVGADKARDSCKNCDKHTAESRGRMKLKFRIWLAAASSFLLSGCAFIVQDRIHYTWAEDSGVTCETCVPNLTDSTLIGVALSGGGSRASVYGAAALEVLANEGILQQATYLSSVSGGGFPAAYYALNKPEPCSTSEPSAHCQSESFSAFKRAMRQDFLAAMTFRQIEKPNRISSPTRRLSSLQDVLNGAFVDGAAFGDLPKEPVLLINGARYDDARRFVFSNVAIPEEDSAEGQFSQSTLRTASFSQPGCTRATPANFSVALALSISAGFPPLLGPASIEMGESCDGGASRFWHLGDGGILDNTGVETIEDYALRAAISERSPKKVIIFAVDAGRSTRSAEMMQERNLKLWTTDPGRVVEIVGKRAQAYRQVALEQLAKDADVSFTIIKLRYTDAEIEAWPASCAKYANSGVSIKEVLAGVPTNLRITDCHADLMELAAKNVIHSGIRDNRELIDAALTNAPRN